MEYSIVYLSSSRILLDEAELIKIVEESRTNNASSNITGVLLSCNGSYSTPAHLTQYAGAQRPAFLY